MNTLQKVKATSAFGFVMAMLVILLWSTRSEAGFTCNYLVDARTGETLTTVVDEPIAYHESYYGNWMTSVVDNGIGIFTWIIYPDGRSHHSRTVLAAGTNIIHTDLTGTCKEF